MFLLLDVLAQGGDGRATDRPREVGPQPTAAVPPVVSARVWEFLPQPAGGHGLGAASHAGEATWAGGSPAGGRARVPVEVGELAAELRVPVSQDLLHALQVPGS